MNRAPRRLHRVTLAFLVAAASSANAKIVQAQVASPSSETSANLLNEQLAVGSFEPIKDGFRRVHRREEVAIGPEDVVELIASGRGDEIMRGRISHDTFQDFLPDNWRTPASIDAGAGNIDSYGNPIVNEVYALPGWAQRDVDALRAEIAGWLLHMNNLDLALAGRADEITAMPRRDRLETYRRDVSQLENDLAETPQALGNFVGQAFVRDIDISDIMPMDHPRMTAEVVGFIARYLHYYENLKAHEASFTNVAWPHAAYPPAVTALLEMHGYSLSQVLAIETAPGDEGGLGGFTFSCYNRSAFAVGWTATVDGIGIWHGVGNPADDHAADVPIGFHYYYQPCLDEYFYESNSVRVASNGYVSFFQQGGGATYGVNNNNIDLPSPIWPDGFVAPWWDNLHIVNQGIVDEVVYKTEGTVGNRVFIVEYWSVSRFGGGTNEFYYFQVRLFEHDQRIQFTYDPGATDPGNESRTVGIEEYEGVDAECGPNCGQSNAGIPVNNYEFRLSAPTNDLCSSPKCLSNDYPVDGTNYGATGFDVVSGCNGDIADVWFTYRCPINGVITLNTCNYSNFDTTLAVFTTCGGALIACNDDFCANGASQLTFTGSAGVNYLVRLAGKDGYRGYYMLRASSGVSGDAPDTCNNVGGATSILGTTANKTGCTSCSGPSDVIDGWMCWTAPSSGTWSATTCNAATLFDSTLGVYRDWQTPALASYLGCNNNAIGANCGTTGARVVWVADAGVTYQIRVAGVNASTGTFQVDLALYNCPADVSPWPQGDRVVGVADLLFVISSWGSCGACRADFVPPGGDNIVGVADMLGVVSAWGACPP